jgi:hypothetical protein
MTVRIDQPRRSLWPERVAYSNGMLLDVADFQVEQAYHRGRLALLTRYLHGTGTVAGLNVEIDTTANPMVVIGPGLGIDRIGRVIENPQPLCLHIDRWFEDRVREAPSELGQSFSVGVGDIPDHVIADIFLGFRECEVAKRPAFSQGDFDALGAVAPMRLRDAAAATLVVRTEDDPPLPSPGPARPAGASAAQRRANLDAAKRTGGWLEDVWWNGIDGALEPDQEHPGEELAADIFLARVLIPAIGGNPPALNPDIVPVADNTARRMVYSTAELMALG